MNRDASITFDWADGTYTFRLLIDQIRALQEKRDSGPEEIWERLVSGKWRVEDIVETIRLGLIGGGLKPDAALTLSRRYVEKRPPGENKLAAIVILAAAIYGVPDEPLKKETGAEPQEPSRSPGESSASPQSTGPGS